ncbi:MAG: ATPase inhibitor subunit zeta [Aestuariivirga sp.]
MPFDQTIEPREGSIIDRRNLLLGYWAGMRLGMFGEELSAYAHEIIKADDEIPGPEDVIARIVADFVARGIDYPEDLIRMELERLERQVRAQSWDVAA